MDYLARTSALSIDEGSAYISRLGISHGFPGPTVANAKAATPKLDYGQCVWLLMATQSSNQIGSDVIGKIPASHAWVYFKASTESEVIPIAVRREPVRKGFPVTKVALA